LGDPHLPGAPAGVAGGRLAALGRTAPLAHLALREPRDLDLGVVAEHRLGELELELVAQVRSAERLGATAAARAAEDVPEHIPEDVAEGVGAESAARSSRAAARLDTGVTVLIVGRALVRVGEHLAGFQTSARPTISTVTPVSRRARSEEHTSELQSPDHLVCRLLL